MFDFLWPGVIGVSIFTVITVFIWSKIRFSWLDKIAFAIVLSLPFERVPSLAVGGVNIRVSQILVLVGFYCMAILLLKSDSQLIKLKINNFFYWLTAFWVALLPSLFFAINGSRQIQVLIATALVFGATFLIVNFLEDVILAAKWLIVVMTSVGIFGIFQFVADFVGVPYSITLLREQYTKRVFGFARVHATALEPLYWGGMLLFPVIFLLLYFVFKKQAQEVDPSSTKTSIMAESQSSEAYFTPLPEGNFTTKADQSIRNISQFAPQKFINTFYSSKWLLLGAISLLVLNLILTLSRGAYLAFGFGLVVATVFACRFISWKVVRTWFLPYFVIIFSCLAVFLVLSDSLNLLYTAVDHILNVFTDKQTSTVERLNFLNDALSLLYQNIISGIGSGNYGPRVQNNIAQGDGGWLIVNNVYLEIWLEQGLLAFGIFVAMLGYYLSASLRQILLKIKQSLATIKTQNNEELVFQISILAGICAYLAQWLTFSPIFIMPFFILFGLLIKSLEL